MSRKSNGCAIRRHKGLNVKTLDSVDDKVINLSDDTEGYEIFNDVLHRCRLAHFQQVNGFSSESAGNLHNRYHEGNEVSFLLKLVN